MSTKKTTNKKPAKKATPAKIGRPTKYKSEYCQEKICSRCKEKKSKIEFGKEAQDGLKSEKESSTIVISKGAKLTKHSSLVF